MSKRNLKNESLMRLASYFSVATALLLIGVKLISFFYTNSLAILSSLMDSGLDLLASYGFQFNNFFFLGIGTGISRFVNKSASAPLFVNARINMLNRHISPVLDCKTGAILGNINGLYFDFGLGVRIATQKKSAIYVLATFIGQCNTGTISAAKDLTNLRYGVKLGYEF